MNITVLPNADRPAYMQIYDQLSEQIISGKLAAGEALPPIRAVAAQTGVSVITVRSAWERLEADGLIETRAGSGCYAADLSLHDREKHKKRLLPLSDLIRAAKKAGLTSDEVNELIRREWENY